MFEAIEQAIQVIFSGYTLLYIIVGILFGIFVGALPGLGAALGMAIVLPLTIYFDGNNALLLLIGIYMGGMYGGSIAAILFNVPGTPAAAATTFDGYELTKQGRAIYALAISATASAFGGFLTIITLLLMSPILIEIVLLFGTPEYFLLAILGIAMITIVTQGSIVKGIAAGMFGLLLTTIGIAPVVPEERFTFGMLALYDGLDFLAILIGLFAITEMIILSMKEGSIADKTTDLGLTGLIRSTASGIKDAILYPVLLIKSSYIGLFIGAIPGAGADVSNFFAYGEAMRSEKNSESFGTGDIRGIIAPEASNNGTVGGALIPTLSFGIPGGAATAVLLGGLLMHGVVPGPSLFEEDLHVTYTMFLGLLIGSLVIFVSGVVFVTQAGVITKIRTEYIVPIIVVLSMAGTYALRSNWIDVFTAVALGIIGYYMVKHEYSIVAFVLGAVLGSIAEDNLQRSLQISGGEWAIFLTRPLSLLLVLMIIFILIGPYIVPYMKRKYIS